MLHHQLTSNVSIGNSGYLIHHGKTPTTALPRVARCHDGGGKTNSRPLADAELRDAVDRISAIAVVERQMDAARLLDYRHYYEYDMDVDDLGDDDKVKATSRVDRQAGSSAAAKISRRTSSRSSPAICALTDARTPRQDRRSRSCHRRSLLQAQRRAHHRLHQALGRSTCRAFSP